MSIVNCIHHDKSAVWLIVAILMKRKSSFSIEFYYSSNWNNIFTFCLLMYNNLTITSLTFKVFKVVHTCFFLMINCYKNEIFSKHLNGTVFKQNIVELKAMRIHVCKVCKQNARKEFEVVIFWSLSNPISINNLQRHIFELTPFSKKTWTIHIYVKFLCLQQGSLWNFNAWIGESC